MEGKFTPVIYNCKTVACCECFKQAPITEKGEINIVGGKKVTFKAKCEHCHAEMDGCFVNQLPTVQNVTKHY